ncbi:ABC transporter permease [Aceticella autotrophica]|uniref:ABC transporter permease n=1 Tax=Aceticella autotrophica TaxID=2755338 RepID=A0A974Y734_9THEO|nr:ABC transporter permease [Aceticella autotrophica]QSZ26423.1 ABC transporter permease [Aceticella autotrophica]
MSFLESFKQAFDSLKNNKLRSILTMLGIIMGVFSVITIVAISNATTAYMNSQFEKIGANVINIQAKYGSNPDDNLLSMSDMDKVKKAVPEIKNICAASQRNAEVKVNGKSRNAFVYGITAQYKNFFPADMAAGRMFNDFDDKGKRNVVVVDENFAKKYFKNNNPIGRVVEVISSNGVSNKFTIIGVLKQAGNIIIAPGMSSDDFPITIYIPLTTLQGMYNNGDKINTLYVSTEKRDQLNDISQRAIKILELTHQSKGKYMAQNVQDVQKIVNSVLSVISSVLLVIAAITLIVGGIGIVNILLVSVTERIKEIGLRKALGAQKRDIILQFLTESIIMTGIGGIIGIILGIGAGMIIANIIKIPSTVNYTVVILAFLGSIALGIIFGVYPAKRAADLDPIEALRYE